MTPSLILRVLLLGSLLPTSPTRVFAQTLVERLGFPPGTKLLIVHADDLGETHSVSAPQALQGGDDQFGEPDGALPMVQRLRLC
jgi:hypothetical protein